MHFHRGVFNVGTAFLMACLQMQAAPEEAPTVKLMLHLTNPTVPLNAQKIPATVTIVNATNEAIKFYFNKVLLVGDGLKGVEFEYSASGEVRIKTRPWYPSVDMGLIKLGPGEKWVGETDLARFIEVAKVGEYQVGVKINVKYYLRDEDERTQPTRTMSGQRTMRLVVRE